MKVCNFPKQRDTRVWQCFQYSHWRTVAHANLKMRFTITTPCNYKGRVNQQSAVASGTDASVASLAGRWAASATRGTRYFRRSPCRVPCAEPGESTALQDVSRAVRGCVTVVSPGVFYRHPTSRPSKWAKSTLCNRSLSKSHTRVTIYSPLREGARNQVLKFLLSSGFPCQYFTTFQKLSITNERSIVILLCSFGINATLYFYQEWDH